MTRKRMDMSQWRHTVAWWDFTIDQHEASDVVDVRFSKGTEDQNVLNVVFSFNIYEVYMVTGDSENRLVLSSCYITSLMEIPIFKTV